MKPTFFAVLILLSSVEVFACLNEYNVNARGQIYEMYEGLPIFYRSFDLAYSKEIVSRTDLTDGDNIDFKEFSDVGIHLARLGKYEQALDIFIWLNEKHKDEYRIVSNLGTLYELNGQVDSAYKYIEKGLKLNPDSHLGSEWVHLSILKAKKHIEEDSDWLLKNKVLNLNLTDTIGLYTEAHDKVMLTIWQISHQLEERIPFTPDSDLLLANVLLELGELLEIHVSIENAYVAYKMAAHYDRENKLGAKEKIKNIMPMFEKHGFNESVFEAHFPHESAYPEENKNDVQHQEFSPKPEDGPIGRWHYFAAAVCVVLLFGLVVFILKKRGG